MLPIRQQARGGGSTHPSSEPNPINQPTIYMCQRFWVLIWFFRVLFTADVVYRIKRCGALKYFLKVKTLDFFFGWCLFVRCVCGGGGE